MKPVSARKTVHPFAQPNGLILAYSTIMSTPSLFIGIGNIPGGMERHQTAVEYFMFFLLEDECFLNLEKAVLFHHGQQEEV